MITIDIYIYQSIEQIIIKTMQHQTVKLDLVKKKLISLKDYGIGLKNLLFEQQIDLEKLKEDIQQQALIHIPSIRIQDIQTGLSEDEHTIFISLTYTNLEDNSLDGVQLNFN